MSSKPVLLTLACVALLGAACGGDDGGDGGGGGTATQVEMAARDFEFENTTIDAEAGDEIELTLINEGEAEHSFTIEGVVEVEAAGGEEASGTFTAPDESAEFFCKYHPDQMRGQLTIGGSAEGDSGGGGGAGQDDDLDY